MSATRKKNPAQAEAVRLHSAGFWPIAIYPPGVELGDRTTTGKEPMGKGWGAERWDVARLGQAWKKHPDAGVGICLGPGRGPDLPNLIDVETDGEDGVAALADLFVGEIPGTMGWSSARGGHLLFGLDDAAYRRLSDVVARYGTEGKGNARGVWHMPGAPGLELRIGGLKEDGTPKQVQSVCPPTPGTDGKPREWNGHREPLPWPESATGRLEELGRAEAERAAGAKGGGHPTNGHHGANGHAPAAAPKRKGRLIARAIDPTDILDRAAAYLDLCEPAISGQRGHDTAFRVVATVGPGFDLDREDCFQLLWERWNPKCQPPWSERELWHKITQAYAKEERRGWLRDAEPPGRNGHHGGGPLVGGDGQDGPERPAVTVSADMHLTVEGAVAALAGEPALYQRGNTLVTILRAPEGKQGQVEYQSAGSPRIVPVPVPRLSELLSRSARFLRYDGRAKDMVPTRVPSWCAEAVAARGEWPGIRSIEGVVEAPTIRPDGSILDRAGYDPATGLVLLPNAAFPEIPGRPDRGQAEAAAVQLLDLVEDFPFVDESHKAAWLAGLLTVVGRFAIPGPCPMFLVDGNVPGAGKSWLCDLAAIIATGREMPRSSYRDDDAEMGKAILSIALAGVRLILFDNVPTGFKIGGGALDRALTGRTFQDRLLGKHQMSPETPLDAVFFATGNNLGLKGDALRRILPIRLESPLERPEERRDFRVKDIKRHARERRGELLAAALTILRGYFVAGRPDQQLTPMSYPEWCAVIRDAVHWATGLDPAAPRASVRDDDDTTQQRHILVQGWARLCRIQGGPKSAAEALRLLKENTEAHRQLHDLLCQWSDDGQLPTTKRLGNTLARERGRPTPHGSLEFKTRDGTRVWFVRPARTDPGSGSSGSSGSLSILRDESCNGEEGGGDSTACNVGGRSREPEPLGPLEPLPGVMEDAARKVLARELARGPVGEVVATIAVCEEIRSHWPVVMEGFPLEAAVESRRRRVEWLRSRVLEPEPPHGLGGYVKRYEGMRGAASFFVLPEHEAEGQWPPSAIAYQDAREAAADSGLAHGGQGAPGRAGEDERAAF